MFRIYKLIIYQKSGTKTRLKTIHINLIAKPLGSNVTKTLSGLHCFIDCDTIRCFSGKEKLLAYKIFKLSSNF